MKKDTTLSLVIPPFPAFIEGNITQYSKGQVHPNRHNLPYFDLIFVQEGALYLTEEGCSWTVQKDEMLILLPNRHHFATKACEQTTKFYWIHFHYDGHYIEDAASQVLNSSVLFPDLHYHGDDYTLHLKKHQKLADSTFIYALLDRLLEGTLESRRSLAFWDSQKRFSQLLKTLEEQSYSKTTAIELAEKIELYIKQNFKTIITNQTLSEEFHFHENYLIRCMKQAFNCTPLEFLNQYRLEKAANLLIKTNQSIAEVALNVGFQNNAYFSSCFKKEFGHSPLKYRKNHTGGAAT